MTRGTILVYLNKRRNRFDDRFHMLLAALVYHFLHKKALAFRVLRVPEAFHCGADHGNKRTKCLQMQLSNGTTSCFQSVSSAKISLVKALPNLKARSVLKVLPRPGPPKAAGPGPGVLPPPSQAPGLLLVVRAVPNGIEFRVQSSLSTGN